MGTSRCRDGTWTFPNVGIHRAVAAGIAVIAFAASWYRHATFRSTTYDLAVFEQALWKMANGDAPDVTLIGWNVFADHLSPVLLAFVPLYALAATPLWLFAAQALAAGLTYLAVPPLLDELDVPGPRRWPVLVAVAVSPLLWNAVLFDFHPTTLAMPFLIVGITAALRDDLRRLAACSAMLVLLRDDLGILVVALAFFGFRSFTNPQHRRARLVIAALGLAWLVAGALFAAAAGSDRHWEARYGALGDSAVDAIAHPLTSVPALVDQLASRDSAEIVALWLLGFSFLPVLAPLRLLPAALVALPLLGADDVNFHSVAYHYGAPALPFLAAAAGAGIAKLPERYFRPHAVVAVPALAAFAFVIVGPPATRALTRDTFPVADGRAAVAAIADRAGVVAPAFVGAHVAHRDLLLPFPYPFLPAARNFPLADDVTELSDRRRRAVDVVIIAPSPIKGENALMRDFLRSRFAEDFCRERHGQVLLLRRC